MNDYDRLYLLMAKWKLVSHLFNPLCYVGNVKSIADLEVHLETNWRDFSKDWLQSWQASLTYSDDIETIKKMVADSKSVNLEELPAILGIKKNNYKDRLEAAGVLLIPKDQLSLQRRIALGRPYSGDVYLATWTRHDDTKVEVVLRCDVNSMQRELFIREAKMMCGIQHNNIMNFYGAVILGTYTDSVGLVVELFSMGNLEEFGVSSIFQAWLYAWQFSSALEYLERRQILHTSIMEPFIYISSREKIKIGGFMFCYSKQEIEEAKQSGSPLPIMIGHQGRQLDGLSAKSVVAVFGDIVTSMFRYLVSHCSSEPLKLFPDDYKWSHFCSRGVSTLLKRCMSSDAEARPSFEEIVNVLAKEKPTKLCFKWKYSSAEVCELSYDEGEVVWVISQDPTRYQGMWFGQKENGKAGFFNPRNTTVADDGNQVPHEIRARGIEAELAYKSALMEGEVQVCRARLLIIGQDRAGKTSLKKSLLGLPFHPNEPSTEGLEVNPSRFEVSVEQVIHWKPVVDEERDGTQVQERNIAKLVAERLERIKVANTTVQGRIEEDEEKSANTHVLVAVPSDETPKHRVPSSEDLPDGPSLHQNGARIHHPTQGPQIQMPNSLVPLVAECLRTLSLPSAEDSRTKETVLDIWDFAGQHLYYSTHPVFFSRRAIYLLVYNLSKNLHDLAEPTYQQGAHTTRLSNTSGETNLDTLKSWLASVHCIRQPPPDHRASEAEFPYRPPPVLVVGTHADKLPSPVDVQEVEAEISSAIADKAYQEHVLRPFYNVNNTLSSRSPGVKEIQEKVREILETGPRMIENLPVKWLNFEKAVKKLAEKGTFFVSLDHVRNVAREECFIDAERQLDAMLNFYHDLGVIVRFKEIVVINSRWLIDLFRELITVRPFKDQDPVDGRLWEDLEKTGILHPRLINRVFAGSVGSTFHQQSILEMMEMYGFVAKFVCQEQRQGCDVVRYFVPAQLTVSPEDLWDLGPGDFDPCPLLFKFLDGFVPHGLFPQLVSRLVSRCPELECFECPKLFYNGVRLGLGRQNQFDLVLLCSKHYIKLVWRSYGSSLSNDVRENETVSAIQVRALVEDELTSLCQQWQWLGNARYEVCVPCLPCGEFAGREKDSSFHMIPVRADDPRKLLTCSRVFGDRSRFKLPGLDKWYINMPLQEQSLTSRRKFAFVSSIDLIGLAGDIGTKWKLIGRILGLQESLLDQIEADKKELYEKCHSMLLSWRQRQQSDATCERLAQALCHKHVMKNDLVEQYCYDN